MTPLPQWVENLPVLLENDTMTGQCRFRRLKDADYKKLLKALEIAMGALKKMQADSDVIPDDRGDIGESCFFWREDLDAILEQIEKLGEKE